MQRTEAVVLSPAATVRVRFPHGVEAIPTVLEDRPVRFATIDRDGRLTAWFGDDAPELCHGYGAWVGQSEADSVDLGRVCSGNYPAYRQALRDVGDVSPRSTGSALEEGVPASVLP